MTNDKRQDIIEVNLADEIKSSYLDYAMSIIVSRAIPDVCDGFKPVHRRILYAMYDGGYHYNKQHRKSMAIVGEVLKHYHPHGNVAVYDAMVRLAQDFSMRLPLVDGQGNFGSIDGDPPAAERYTEARLKQVAHSLMLDIDKDTVTFAPNYDNTTTEPTVLPARFPNLLVNGAGGIAVGMATNIPPHNLGEVLDACLHLLDNPEASLEEIMEFVKAPDFPTGGYIIGQRGAVEAYETGKGAVVMRARTHVEEVNNRKAIIVTEIPYQVNKARLVERIAELVNTKVVEGIADLRDESDRRGMRVVIELKKDVDPDVILNQLFRLTPLQCAFNCNMLALNEGRPETMGLLAMLRAFLAFREKVITRRTNFLLNKAREKAQIYLGLVVAVANIDEVIALIRAAKSPVEAKEQLMARAWAADSVASLIEMVEAQAPKQNIYHLSEAQAKAILDLRLHRLTGLEQDKITEDLNQVLEEIRGCLDILQNRDKLVGVIRDEFEEIREKYANPRRSEIIEAELTDDIESLIQKEDMVITVTHKGYIKRVPAKSYRAQKRGGKGRSGMSTRDEDFVDRVFVENTHTPLLFFTTKGQVYNLKVYKLPISSATALGKPIINLLPIDKDEKIATIMPMPEDEQTWSDLQIMFATDKGNIRRNNLSDFTNIRANGKIAMKLEEGEQLIGVAACSDDNDVLLTATNGRSVRCNVTQVRVFASRSSTGVRGIKLAGKDKVVSMAILNKTDYSPEERESYLKLSRKARQGALVEADFAEENMDQHLYEQMAEQEQFILSVTERGYGKRSSSYEFRQTNRGTQGIMNMEVTSKTGGIIASFPVEHDDELMIITDQGQLIRSKIDEIRIAGRRTQGVRLFNIDQKTKVVAADWIRDTKDDDELDEDEEGESGLGGQVDVEKIGEIEVPNDDGSDNNAAADTHAADIDDSEE
ncbi:MAG: DNA gyrase subunit A [Rickettsiales bacterium]|nr:DNA gyrase subunit A [Rickettsiales bacterium]